MHLMMLLLASPDRLRIRLTAMLAIRRPRKQLLARSQWHTADARRSDCCVRMTLARVFWEAPPVESVRKNRRPTRSCVTNEPRHEAKPSRARGAPEFSRFGVCREFSLFERAGRPRACRNKLERACPFDTTRSSPSRRPVSLSWRWAGANISSAVIVVAVVVLLGFRQRNDNVSRRGPSDPMRLVVSHNLAATAGTDSGFSRVARLERVQV